MHTVRFGNSYEICLPDTRAEIGARFKELNPKGDRIISLEDPEKQDYFCENSQMEAVLGLDDYDDISILMSNPSEINGLNYRLVRAALEYLVEQCGMPREFMDKTLLLLRSHKYKDIHSRISFRD
jgi:hypothetical protein